MLLEKLKWIVIFVGGSCLSKRRHVVVVFIFFILTLCQIKKFLNICYLSNEILSSFFLLETNNKNGSLMYLEFIMICILLYFFNNIFLH